MLWHMEDVDLFVHQLNCMKESCPTILRERKSLLNRENSGGVVDEDGLRNRAPPL